jgi:hypothetical protein
MAIPAVKERTKRKKNVEGENLALEQKLMIQTLNVEGNSRQLTASWTWKTVTNCRGIERTQLLQVVSRPLVQISR